MSTEETETNDETFTVETLLATDVPTPLAAPSSSTAADSTEATQSPSVAVAEVTTRRPSAVPSADPSSRAPSINNKSKKKKAQTQMGLPGAQGNQGENTGRWTAEEHRLFLQGLEQHGKGWKKIASLIKSRTVVQIRTHAQKYFQKLAKARQNGDEGEITMEGRGISSVTSTSSVIPSPKRRRPVTGTKRKAIQSVVASAQRQGKKLAASQLASGVPNPIAPIPAIAPALAHFVLPRGSGLAMDCIPPPGTISGLDLEDSLFRFLSPCPPADAQVNYVARQVGANPISLPSDTPCASGSGEISPTGVNDLSIYPSWTDAKETPSWYAKGADVDALLDVADTLDWLADTGDLNETYQPPPMETVTNAEDEAARALADATEAVLKESTSISTLPRIESSTDGMDPSLSLFQNESAYNLLSPSGPSSGILKPSPSGTSMLDVHLHVFDTPLEEQAFVSTILANCDESADNFPSLT